MKKNNFVPKEIFQLKPEAGALNVLPGQILDLLKVPPAEAGDYLMEQIDLLIRECLDQCKPEGCYACFDHPEFDRGGGNMLLEGVRFSLHKKVASALAKSDGVVFFICTCGSGPEKLSGKHMREGNMLEALLVDLIGSVLAESLAEYMHSSIATHMAKSGLNTTNRYSPGYCLWPVSDQQKLFSLLPGHHCGVQLNQASLMQPVKSVSGIIGVGREVKSRAYACSGCDIDYCLYRIEKKGSQGISSR